jgi:hypothetical protein
MARTSGEPGDRSGDVRGLTFYRAVQAALIDAGLRTLGTIT